MKYYNSILINICIISLLCFSLNKIAFAQLKGMQIPPVHELEQENIGYSNSWAFIVGIDKYPDYPDLRTAVSGAKALVKYLENDLGFPKNNIIELYNNNATKDSIEYYTEDFLVKNVKKGDRLLIYFSGHGETFTNSIGYICPADAKQNSITSTGIAMNDIIQYNQILSAKHILYLFDCCFSGMAFARGTLSGISPDNKSYYREILKKPARQAITAGEEDELVYDTGPEGKYSPFTYFLLEGLKTEETKDEYKIISATKLGQFIKEKVGKYTNGAQNPIIDRFPDSGRGEFLLWEDKDPEPFKNYRLKNVQSQTANIHSIIDYSVKNSNKKYFLFVFWDYYCLPCKLELKYLYEKALPQKLQVITVNLDDPQNIKTKTLSKNFINEYKSFINLFPFNREQLNSIKEDININAAPVTILIDKDKNITNRRVGFPRSADEKERQVFKQKFIDIAQ